MFELLDQYQVKELHVRDDAGSGLKAFIAIHNTQFGPALGGCRFIEYDNETQAIQDVISLARGMSYKAALAGVPQGGGKAVIMKPRGEFDPHKLFTEFGRFVESLGGQYITAIDSGTTANEMDIIQGATSFVTSTSEAGNPSAYTAKGVFEGIKAAVKFKLGKDDLTGIKVAVQGLGSVGYSLCEKLHNAGAELIVTDINQVALDKAAAELNATVVGLDEIYSQDVDVFSPCALGASIDDNTIPQLKAVIIAGCANNQLAEARHDQILLEKGILYAPDYVINAGGIINVALEIYPEPYCADSATKLVENIYHTLMNVFETAAAQNMPTGLIADQMARDIIAKGHNNSN